MAVAIGVWTLGCGGSEKGGGSSGTNAGVPAPDDVGAPCVPSEEHRSTFGGFALDEVVIDPNPSACSDACLVTGFQGRVSCPYGQTAGPSQCSLPCASDPVTVPVPPQLVARAPFHSVYCSCPCDGSGPGPYCTCPTGFVCADVTHGVAPSYCVREGSLPESAEAAARGVKCDPMTQSCGIPSPNVCTAEGGAAPADATGSEEPVRRAFSEVVKTRVPKLDLLLSVDNSVGMGDKQRLLQQALPDLIARLANPLCVSPDTGETESAESSSAPCPAGLAREFPPVEDMHVGIVTSSLGGFGAEICEDSEAENDYGELLASRPRAAGLAGSAPSGFLEWTPGTDQSDFVASFSDLVGAASEHGCGFEAVLESWYRFLIDPSPPETVQINSCGTGQCASPAGVDQTILSQRQAFLRPDSVVAILMISDENDCSMQNTGQLFYAARSDVTLPRATAVCNRNPNDPCCYSCGTEPPPECLRPPDDCADPVLDESDDPLNLRCFDQKRRFGLEFLYPTERYVRALSDRQLCTSRADLAATAPDACPDADGDGLPDIFPSALFADLTGAGNNVDRPASDVVLAGIVGVPWQDLATPESLSQPSGPLSYQSGLELEANDLWSVIVGDPSTSPPVPPGDPLMRESIAPRAELEPPTADRLANPINGHEWTNSNGDDLQYACIYPLAEPRDCSGGVAQSSACDCSEAIAGQNNPLCQAPDGSYGTTQYFDRAYPGGRQLDVLHQLGGNGVTTSICARNTTDPAAPDFGYRPAMSAVVDRLSTSFGARCFEQALPTSSSGDRALCRLFEAQPSPEAGCGGPSQSSLTGDAPEKAVYAALEIQGVCGGASGRSCEGPAWTVCEVPQSQHDDDGDGVADCLDGSTVDDGWCYVEPDAGIGDPRLVAHCPENARRMLRTPAGVPLQGATLVLVCDTAQ